MSRFLTLNVGASKATLAEYALAGKRALTLVAYGTAPLEGVQIDAAGSLAAALTPALLAVMREKGIRPAPVVMSLGGHMVFPRFAKFPPVGAEKLEQMVRYEVEQNVPFPVDEIVCDHQFLGRTEEGEEAAMIVAAKLDQVREATDAVVAAGLTPALVDVSPMALCNALKAAHPDLDGCNVILDVGAKTTSLIILEGEKIYNRSIPVAGNAITKELAQTFGCSLEEAEELKRTRGYVSLGGVTEDADEVADRASKVIRTVLTRLHAEISRSINFYRSQQGGAAPSRLFLTGGTVVLPELDRFFQETLQIQVEFLNPFTVVKAGAKVNAAQLETDAFSLAESAGLALRKTDSAALHIDLMPPELVARARAAKRVPFLAVAGVVVLAALGVGIFAENCAAEARQAEVACVQRRNETLKRLETQLKKEQSAADDELAKADAFQQLLASRSTELRRLDAVRRSLVPGMWITAWAPQKDGGVRVTVRGWSDAMQKKEAEYAAKHGGRKSTAAEIVQFALKERVKVVAPDSVKIVAQNDVRGRGCLLEFTLQMNFAPPASAVVVEAKGKKKGGK